MSANFIAKTTVNIEAPPAKVWEALTNPDLIKQYFYGTNAESDWQEGSEILYKGEWQGKTYVDKGTILKMIPEKLFQHTYLSSFSELEDAPENYANIIYELDEENGSTLLTVKQENIASEELRQQSEQNWKQVLNDMKELLEHNGQPVNSK